MHIMLGRRGSDSSARIVGHPELFAQVAINAFAGEVKRYFKSPAIRLRVYVTAGKSGPRMTSELRSTRLESPGPLHTDEEKNQDMSYSQESSQQAVTWDTELRDD
jgi:hypothetical protein